MLEVLLSCVYAITRRKEEEVLSMYEKARAGRNISVQWRCCRARGGARRRPRRVGCRCLRTRPGAYPRTWWRSIDLPTYLVCLYGVIIVSISLVSSFGGVVLDRAKAWWPIVDLSIWFWAGVGERQPLPRSVRWPCRENCDASVDYFSFALMVVMFRLCVDVAAIIIVTRLLCSFQIALLCCREGTLVGSSDLDVYPPALTRESYGDSMYIFSCCCFCRGKFGMSAFHCIIFLATIFLFALRSFCMPMITRSLPADLLLNGQVCSCCGLVSMMRKSGGMAAGIVVGFQDA